MSSPPFRLFAESDRDAPYLSFDQLWRCHCVKSTFIYHLINKIWELRLSDRRGLVSWDWSVAWDRLGKTRRLDVQMLKASPPNQRISRETIRQSPSAKCNQRATATRSDPTRGHHHARSCCVFRRMRVRRANPRTREAAADHPTPALPILSHQGSAYRARLSGSLRRPLEGVVGQADHGPARTIEVKAYPILSRACVSNPHL